MLCYYYAQLLDTKLGGEWSLDDSWPSLSKAVDVSDAITVSRSQFESLLYSYKLGIMDKRRPFKICNQFQKTYLNLLKELKAHLPDVLKEEKDGEILIHGEGFSHDG